MKYNRYSLHSAFIALSILFYNCSSDSAQSTPDPELIQARLERTKDSLATAKADSLEFSNSMKRRMETLKVKVMSYKILDSYRIDQEPYTFKVSVTNTSDKPIRAFTGQIYFYDLVGEYAINGRYSESIYKLGVIHQDILKSGATTILTLAPPSSKETYQPMKILRNRRLSNMNVFFVMEELLFEDGEKL